MPLKSELVSLLTAFVLSTVWSIPFNIACCSSALRFSNRLSWIQTSGYPPFSQNLCPLKQDCRSVLSLNWMPAVVASAARAELRESTLLLSCCRRFWLTQQLWAAQPGFLAVVEADLG